MKCSTLVRTDQIDHDQWLEYRRKGIGGSDAGAILGLSRYASAFSVWHDKVHGAGEFTSNEAIEWGNDLERIVAEKYAKTSGDRVLAVPALLQCDRNPFMLANVDFFILRDDAPIIYKRGEVTDIPRTLDYEDIEAYVDAILEIKTTGIAGRGNGQAWANDGVPPTYEAQGKHYCAVTGLNRVVFAALIGGQGLAIRERIYTPLAIADLVGAERKFWESVQSGEAPDPSGVDADFAIIKSLNPVSDGTEVEADDFAAENIAHYRTLKAQADELDTRLKASRAKIEAFIGSAETVTYEGQTLLTYKSTKPRATLDAKLLTEMHPDIVAEFTYERPGSRVMRIKGE